MQAIINQINNTDLIIKDLAGRVMVIELKLRLLAESNESFRAEVYRLIEISKCGKGKNQYWNCDLKILVCAFELSFCSQLTPDEKSAMKNFNQVRNKLLHGDFVELMETLGLPAEGQEVLSSGKRPRLEWKDKDYAVKNKTLQQAINRFELNGATKGVVDRSVGINSAIDRFLRSE